MNNMLKIVNNGQAIASTNFWDSEHAASGLMYLSGNAGALRLLVPRVAETWLPEMKTANQVVIERRAKTARLVFDDGTDAPFVVDLDLRMCERALKPASDVPFDIWTEDGKQVSLTATVKA